jgi:hypothetical protein
MDHTILLYVTAIFDLNGPPIAAKDGARTDIAVLADRHLTDHDSLWVYITAGVYHGSNSIGLIVHKVIIR